MRLVVIASITFGAAAATAVAAAADDGPLFSPGGGCEETLVSAVDGARDAVDVELYYFTDPTLGDALIRAAGRGVAVRVLLDGGQKDLPASQGPRLAAAGIAVRYERGRGLLHAKLAIFDKKAAAVGSYNWTRRAEEENVEILMFVDDAEYIQAFRDHFAAAWAAAAHPRLSPASPAPNAAAAYVASASSGRFHYPTCVYVKKINEDNRVEYATRDEALAAGKQPCYYCCP